ncbi:hypothetical protein J1N51_03705 [Psychrosphaera ytuae]|uniref:Sulfurtransferase complex subunit TusB n=1 Tax=Psychrosphaera ytuae TaxID=2820710 RepID=A0A975DFB0_9GAMM|nr:DsrH/TusB family sulfur metabolism protein [Psychrosphaera ytuae]QTH64585.1 hypothetical protein J1N51_03705 [Psychrosphaera ytuae]
MPFSSHEYSLHLIFSPDGWLKAQPLVTSTDRVFFMQDAVYLLQANITSPSELLYARATDVLARNIHPSEAIEILDDEQWVKLTEQANNVLSW